MIIGSSSHSATSSFGILSLLLALTLLFSGCEKFSCHGQPERIGAQNAARWAEQARVAQFIPKTARTVAFSRDLPTMLEALRFGSTRLPRPSLAPFAEQWATATGINFMEDASLEQLGLDAARPSAIFYDRGFWSVAASVEHAETLQKALEALTQRETIEATESDFGSMSLIKLSIAASAGADAPEAADPTDLARRTIFVAHDDNTMLLAVRVEESALHSDASTLPDAWLPESTKSRFIEDADHRKLLREMYSVGEVIAVVRPAAWLANRSTSGQVAGNEAGLGQAAGPAATGQAGVLLERILDQVGPVGIAASSVSFDKSVRVRVLTPGNPRSPAMITTLGKAEGDIPTLGGIIAPGVLGVARLSVSPRQLYDLLLSALPAERRQDVAAFWDELDGELRINAQRDVLENLRGHAIVVAYGLDRDSLEASNAPWYLDVVKLEATREAVLLPIKEREPLEQVLNALTTVSKGKLTRQEVGHTLQYAWLDDGRLQWAVILSDENLIYVDSSVAFDHAVEYERGAGPLSKQVEEAGITRVFDKEASAGIYLDTASLTSMLGEADNEHAVGWIAAFRTAIVTIKEQAEMGVTEIDLAIAPAPQ